MNKKDFISSFVWIFVGLIIVWQSFQLPLGSYRSPGPGYIPFGVGLGMVAISVFLLVRAAFSAPPQGLQVEISRHFLKKLGIVLGALFLYAAGLVYLGFLLSTFLFLLLLFKGVEPQKWGPATLWAGAVTLAAYLLFCLALRCELPRGLMGI